MKLSKNCRDVTLTSLQEKNNRCLKMNKIDYLLQDWQINNDTSFKSRLTLLLFRLTQTLTHLPIPFSSLSVVYRIFYQLLVEWVLGIELPWDVKIGPNLKLHHGHALVVNHETIIGANCTLRHSTTIGNKKLPDGSCSASPRIGNYVDIGSNSVILGPVLIGDHAVIGAGSVVVKDVPAGAVAVGNPARVIRIIDVTSTVNAAAASKLAAAASNTNNNSHA